MPGEGPPGEYKRLQDSEQPVVTGWQWDALGEEEEEENICLSVQVSAACSAAWALPVLWGTDSADL